VAGDRKSQLELRSLAESFAVGQQLSVVGLDDRLGDGQPDPASGTADRSGGVTR
jgi:hypothetical protein